jgi:hypothetical protein
MPDGKIARLLVFRLRDQTPSATEVLGTLQVRPNSSPADIASFSAPEIDVVMSTPAGESVGFGRGAGAGVPKVGDEVDEGLGAVGEVTGFGGPVVHLDIDVGGPGGAPGGWTLSFQMPCRLAGCEPGRELLMRR